MNLFINLTLLVELKDLFEINLKLYSLFKLDELKIMELNDDFNICPSISYIYIHFRPPFILCILYILNYSNDVNF